MTFINFKKSGETLLEIIIAVLIIGIGASAALSLVSNASRVNESSSKRIVAVNLAKEALEVFANIRNSNLQSVNYLTYTDCWRASDINTCNSSTDHGDLWGDNLNGDYLVYLDPSQMSFKIGSSTKHIEADLSQNKIADIFRVWSAGNLNNLYLQLPPEINTSSYTATDFYRSIQIKKIDQKTTSDIIELTAIVYFKNRNTFSKVSISQILTLGKS